MLSPYDSEPRSLKIAYLTHRREPKIRVDPYAKFGALSYAHYLKPSETFSTVSVESSIVYFRDLRPVKSTFVHSHMVSLWLRPAPCYNIRISNTEQLLTTLSAVDNKGAECLASVALIDM